MSDTCTFILCDGYYPSDDYAQWEVEGTKERIEDPNRYHKDVIPTDQYWMVTVKAGQYIFLDENCEKRGEMVCRCTLFRAPTDPAQFAVFKKKAEAVAGQAVYDRILGYKRGPRYGGGPYDYTNDFGGGWLDEFSVREWTDDSHPRNLAEALQLVTT